MNPEATVQGDTISLAHLWGCPAKVQRWVWLDLDDTLWDFRGNSPIALEDTYHRYNLREFWKTNEDWQDVYHRHNEELWRLYSPGLITADFLRMERFRRPLAEAGCPDDRARELSLTMDAYYLARLAEMPHVVPGAHELLKRLRDAGYGIGVLSNGFKDTQYGKMSSAGIAGMVDCVVLSDEVGVTKPLEPIFRFAREKAGVTAEDCLMIGDNPDTDIRGALSAGWRAVWLNISGKGCPIALEQWRDRLAIVSTLAQIQP